jgi:two-component system sensor histidine kinase/response regulator
MEILKESHVIAATYDYRLVALSVLIAICASYAALDLAGRVAVARGKGRLAWLSGGALAMGTGIWAMHYTGMLAYRLPVPVYYHIPTVALSLAAAICASFIALYIVGRQELGSFHVAAGSFLMGTAIAAMHYTGMAAMRLPAMHHWDFELVLVSLGIAVVVSLAALVLTFIFREEKQGLLLKIICSLVMGGAIPAMHYTAMAAVSYTSMPMMPDLGNAVDISALGNAAIIIVTFVILGCVFVFRWRETARLRKTPVAQVPSRQPASECFDQHQIVPRA